MLFLQRSLASDCFLERDNEQTGAPIEVFGRRFLAGLHRLHSDTPGSGLTTGPSQTMKLCAKCKSSKTLAHFELGGDTSASQWCRQCELQRMHHHSECLKCHRVLLLREFTHEELEQAAGNTEKKLPLCKKCRPRPTFTCSICKVQKGRDEYKSGAIQRHEGSGILRCRTCHTCVKCHTEYRDGRQFVTKSSLCFKRSRSSAPSSMHLCVVCQSDKPLSAFPKTS